MKMLPIVCFHPLFRALACLAAGLFFAGPAHPQSLPLKPFDQIEMTGAFTVFLSGGDRDELRIEGSAARANKLAVRYRKNNLLLYEDSVDYGDPADLKLYLTVRQVRHLRLKGRVNVTTDGLAEAALAVFVPEESRISLQARVDTLSLEAKDGGSVQLTLEANQANIRASYGGNVQATGRAASQWVDLYEGSRLDAFGFECRSARLKVQVGSQARVQVTDALQVTSDVRSTVLVKGATPVLTKYYRDDELLVTTGYGYLQEEALDEAAEFFRLGARLFPASWRSYAGLSEVYRVRGQADSVQRNLDRARAINAPALKAAADYLRKGYVRATVRTALTNKGENIPSCQDFVLQVETISNPICIGDNLPANYRRDGQDVWVKYQETKLGELYDKGHLIVMNDCCGLIVQLLDVKTRAEQ